MPSTNAAADWTRLMVDASLLCADAGMVMALRSWRMMGGGVRAQREFEQMVSEKVSAGFELAGVLAAGNVHSVEGAARKTLSIYGRHVRSNRRRLGH